MGLLVLIPITEVFSELRVPVKARRVSIPPLFKDIVVKFSYQLIRDSVPGEQNVPIWHGILPETRDIRAYPVIISEKAVVLVDTAGAYFE